MPSSGNEKKQGNRSLSFQSLKTAHGRNVGISTYDDLLDVNWLQLETGINHASLDIIFGLQLVAFVMYQAVI